MPLRIADLTWTLTLKEPGGPGLGLAIALAVLGIYLAALLGALVVAWGESSPRPTRRCTRRRARGRYRGPRSARPRCTRASLRGAGSALLETRRFANAI